MSVKVQIILMIFCALFLVSSSVPVYTQYRTVYRNKKDNGHRKQAASYNEICRGHAYNNLAFPGQIGNPVCPW